MDSAIRHTRIFVNLTGYYIARGWAIWAVRRIAGVACCLGLMVMLPIMAYNSGKLQGSGPIKLASTSLVAGQPEELNPVASPAIASATAQVEQQVIAAEIQRTIQPFTRLRRPGNSYVYGHCTFYVSQRRPDVPGGWGHARTWLSGAQRSGYKTGTVPAVGAIAQSPFGYYGHVAVVEEVKGDTVRVSEMNYVRWNTVSERWVPAGAFRYIY